MEKNQDRDTTKYHGRLGSKRKHQTFFPEAILPEEQMPISCAVAYPELVSRGVSERRKCKRLVKVGASNGVTT